MLQTLELAGIPYFSPQGAYYVLADISRFGYPSDIEFTYYLIQTIGVAVVPGSGFFKRPAPGQSFIRFCFSKQLETLQAARDRLLNLLWISNDLAN